MLETDYLLMMTSGLLSVNANQLENRFQELAENYELQEECKPGYVSLGGRGEKGGRLPFTEWIKSIRGQIVEEMRFNYIAVDRPGLPAHAATAFAGIIELLLELRTLQGRSCFILESRSSPAYRLDSKLFTELINKQPLKDLLWLRIHEMLNESNGLNDRSPVELSNISDYLAGAEGIEVFESLLPDWIRELQIECMVNRGDFLIPEAFAEYFYKPDFNFRVADKDHVYLYNLKEVDGPELKGLIEAQPFCEKIVSEIRVESGIPYQLGQKGSTAEWLEVLEKMKSSELKDFSQIVFDKIIDICEKENQLPLIPSWLAESFGPNELDQQRARARGKLRDRWQLKPNDQSWRSYLFEKVVVPEASASPNPQSKELFYALLREIEAFAEKIQSPFAEAFKLATFTLSNDFSAKQFTADEFASIKSSLTSQRLSDQAWEVLGKNFYYAEKMNLFGWPADKLKGLLACICADVFGGMGSWNDYYPENQADVETYEHLTAAFFQARKEYFASLLSWRS